MQRPAHDSASVFHTPVAVLDPPSAPAAQALHVLIADANARTRATRVEQLLAAGLRVSMARTSFEAIVKATCTVPDVILLDLNMSVMDGETFARRYRSQYGHQVPIVICTTSPPPSIMERNGNVSLLRKPIELDNLLETVHQLSNDGTRP